MHISNKFGSARRGTILKYLGNGNVLVGLDEVGLAQVPQQFEVPIPMAWSGPNGEFSGGYPTRGSSVSLSQSQGGQWFIDSYLPSRGVFTTKDLLSDLREGRWLTQVKNGNRLLVDPKVGIQAGDASAFLQIDPQREILTHNLKMDMEFTEAGRHIRGVIKRDLVENSNRGLLGPPLDSVVYDDSLYTISLDPTTSPSVTTSGERVRNLPLAEEREIVYEFANSYVFTNDAEEAARYADEKSFVSKLNQGRRDNRSDALSLGLTFPNHLMETIKGTVVDAFGNVLDLNRNVIPLGQLDKLSLRSNPDKSDAFTRLRSEHRKGIAFHFELNARKSLGLDTSNEDSTAPSPTPPDVTDTDNYARDRSRFFIDIDKEGQAKINIPASSETGNLPLLTRYENYSTLLANKDGSTDPNLLIRNSSNQEIFLDNFGAASIKLKSTDSLLDGYEAPIDRLTSEPIKYGTAFHDITKTCSTFLPDFGDVISYDSNHYLNQIEPYEKIVSDTITVSGKDANAGGRSANINLDGFLSLNIGANTVDRQSLWLDCAGGIVSQIGRDKRGISYAANLDGDMIIQVGGIGLGNSLDDRFTDQNDAVRLGKVDIRVLSEAGQFTVIRVDSNGVSIATPGHLDFLAGGDVAFKSYGSMSFNAERVTFYSDCGLVREVERRPVNI